MKFLKSCLILMMAMILFSPFALGASDGIVDVQALKAIEDSDDCPVVIVNKQIVRGVGGISLEGSDVLQFTIENQSESSIHNINLYLVAYDKDDKQVSLGLGFTLGHQPQSFGGDIFIGKGGEKTVSIRCNADDIAGVRAIVYSFTSTDRVVHENTNAQHWLDEVYVVSASRCKWPLSAASRVAISGQSRP